MTGNLRHGMRSSGDRQSRVYTAWRNMKARCTMQGDQWKDYAGRGIGYDPAWEKFEAFYADMGDPPPGTTLERNDNDLGYSKANCRWATRAEQRRNARNLRMIELDGQPVCMRDFCAAKGLKYGRVIDRLYRGWPIERAISP